MNNGFSEKEIYSMNVEHAQKALERHYDFEAKMNDAAILSAHNAIRTLILFHGGALIAMLTFIGSIIESPVATLAGEQLGQAMLYFAYGLSLAGFCSLAAYIVNYTNAQSAWATDKKLDWPYIVDNLKSKSWQLVTTLFHILALLAAIASLVFFCLGFMIAKSAIVDALP